MAKSKEPARRRVSFEIKAAAGSEVFIAGTFNGWRPRQKRLREKSGVYRISLVLPKGEHEYKFIVDDVWHVDPECPDWIPNGMGSLNSVVTVK